MERRQPAIVVEGIYKSFRGNYGKASKTQGEENRSIWSKILKGKGEELWALRGVDFMVDKGDVLGIVGQNGAGKSVLFKIMARIMRPTKGGVKVNGSLIAMLEVNDSFYKELTGRENIYLSMATYGAKITDVQQMMDDIATLSEVGDFLHVPVKRFSSGMRTKLAFAIAFMMQPDILILDEILSVSDVSFREKSMDLLRRQNRERGQTQLLVSHDLSIVKALCTKALWLEGGKVLRLGDAEEVINEYMASKERDNG